MHSNPYDETADLAFEAGGAGADYERWAGLVAATAIAAYGLNRRSVPGFCMAIAAVPLAYRGITGDWPRLINGHADTREALSGRRGIDVRESIRLERPVDEVYRFWRQLENLPRFMTYLDRVTDLGNRRSHWVAKGPAGIHAEWTAEIINEIENELIAWRSLPDSTVATAGSVAFSTVRGGRSSEVAVHLQYNPPAGKAGALFATIFGREPSQTIREDLRRFKQILEAGEVPRSRANDRSDQ